MTLVDRFAMTDIPILYLSEPLAKFSGIVAILDGQEHFEPAMVLCDTKQLGQSNCDRVRGEDSGIPARRGQALTGSFGALGFLRGRVPLK